MTRVEGARQAVKEGANLFDMASLEDQLKGEARFSSTYVRKDLGGISERDFDNRKHFSISDPASFYFDPTGAPNLTGALPTPSLKHLALHSPSSLPSILPPTINPPLNIHTTPPHKV